MELTTIANLSCIKLSCSDINECVDNPNICGPGECIDQGNGDFYSCNCPPGSVSNGGDPSTGALTCIVGM